ARAVDAQPEIRRCDIADAIHGAEVRGNDGIGWWVDGPYLDRARERVGVLGDDEAAVEQRRQRDGPELERPVVGDEPEGAGHRLRPRVPAGSRSARGLPFEATVAGAAASPVFVGGTTTVASIASASALGAVSGPDSAAVSSRAASSVISWSASVSTASVGSGTS